MEQRVGHERDVGGAGAVTGAVARDRAAERDDDPERGGRDRAFPVGEATGGICGAGRGCARERENASGHGHHEPGTARPALRAGGGGTSGGAHTLA